MKKRIVISFLSFCFVLVLQVSGSWAGQVVTGEERTWARQAIDQETTLGAAPSDNTVAVLYFRNNTGSEKINPVGKGLAFMLMTDLAKIENIRLVERVKLQALVEELNLGASGVVDQGTAPRVGKLLKASYLVGGDLGKGESVELKVDSDVLSLPRADILGTPKAEGMLDTLLEMEKKLLFEIVEILKVELTPEKKAELEKPLTTSVDALMSLFMALDCSDRRDYRCAESYYRRALRSDPGLSFARGALDELGSLRLTGPKGKAVTMAEDIQDKTSSTDTLFPDDTERRSGDAGDIDRRESVSGRIRVQWSSTPMN